MNCDSQTADCVNTPGSYQCKCRTGYSGDGIQCKGWCLSVINVNLLVLNDARLFCTEIKFEQHLRNVLTITSRAILIKAEPASHFVISDIDECATKTSTCDKLANCTNQYGTFKCSCPKGYIGDGTTCARKNLPNHFCYVEQYGYSFATPLFHI